MRVNKKTCLTISTALIVLGISALIYENKLSDFGYGPYTTNKYDGAAAILFIVGILGIAISSIAYIYNRLKNYKRWIIISVITLGTLGISYLWFLMLVMGAIWSDTYITQFKGTDGHTYYVYEYGRVNEPEQYIRIRKDDLIEIANQLLGPAAGTTCGDVDCSYNLKDKEILITDKSGSPLYYYNSHTQTGRSIH